MTPTLTLGRAERIDDGHDQVPGALVGSPNLFRWGRTADSVSCSSAVSVRTSCPTILQSSLQPGGAVS